MPTALDLFERHHLTVFRFLVRMGLSREDAEDATQEVFLRVPRALPAYEERQSERAWVFRIARNVRLDQWRAAGRALTPEPLNGEPAARSVPAAERLALEQALEQLGEAERESFVLRQIGGLGYAEIAEATGATPDAVRSRIHRARLALRLALGGPRRLGRAAGGWEG